MVTRSVAPQGNWLMAAATISMVGRRIGRCHILQHVTTDPPQVLLESDNFGAVEAERLESEVIRLMVEVGDCAMVWDWHVGCNDLVSH